MRKKEKHGEKEECGPSGRNNLSPASHMAEEGNEGLPGMCDVF